MPIVKRDKSGSNPLKQSFVERVRSGSVVPILSNEMMADLVLGGRHELVEGYADYVEYPMEDRGDILQIAKFQIITGDMEEYDLKWDFLNYIKNRLYTIAEDEGRDEDELEEAAAEVDSLTASVFAQRLGYPKLDGGTQDPLLIIADLPLPLYLTTSPHTFLETALERSGRKPVSDYSRWHPGLGNFDKTHKPTPTEPLVFHLFGLDTDASSLLLTEDDYLQFLVAVSQENGKENDPIPGLVRQAMSTSAPVLLGYEMSSWAFRVLFWGLIRPATMKHRGVCCLHVEPTEVEKQFFQEYLKKAEFEVFWGDVGTYTQELHRLYRS